MTPPLSESILIARQPIFDQELELYAYELLFRGDLSEESGVTESTADLATTRVIQYAFMEFGIEQIVGSHLAFINLTRTFLTEQLPLPFDTQGVVLEVLEDITVDDEIINSVTKLASKGYTIALDDFIFSDEWRPLIDIASIIKIDIMALTEQELVEHVQVLKSSNTKLLAEKVETRAEFELCKSLGFDFYQGYFFSRPVILDDRPIPNNKLTLLRVLAGLQDSEIDIDELERLVSQDVSLSFKLLRLLNSAAIALPRKIESLGEGLVFLGLNTIKKWAALVALAGMDSFPHEVLTSSLVRAKMCESLAKQFDCGAQSAFIVGLFSMLDVMVSKSMQELLIPIQLGDQIKEALIEKSGNLGQLLAFVIDYEQYFDMDLPQNLTVAEVNEAYLSATAWVISINNQIK